MKPKSPFTQSFEELPDSLPLFPFENALLPGGQVPLELSAENDIQMFFDSLRSHQLIGLVQPKSPRTLSPTFDIGGAGRVRQYRERSDGRINVMLAGVCRFRIIKNLDTCNRYRNALVDWSDFELDYENEEIHPGIGNNFKRELKNYFGKYQMQVDWSRLEPLPTEELVNNLILVMSLSLAEKQKLLETRTVRERLVEFAGMLQLKLDPIVTANQNRQTVN